MKADRKIKYVEDEIGEIWRLFPRKKLERPLIGFRVQAGFPSPAEDYVEGRIDLNKELILHPLATFYLRVTGESMLPDICPGEFLIVDRAVEARHGDVIVARLGDEMCVKELRFVGGQIILHSVNLNFTDIVITEEHDFEIWGKVLWSFKSH